MSYRKIRCLHLQTSNLSNYKFIRKENIMPTPIQQTTSTPTTPIPKPIQQTPIAPTTTPIPTQPTIQEMPIPTADKSSLCKDETCREWEKDPKIWGPHLWMYMHYAAANYPKYPTENDINEMVEWLCTLPVTIPCQNCRFHYKKYIDKEKPRLREICSRRDTLFNFLVDVHNKVNERNNKKIISYEEARELYR